MNNLLAALVNGALISGAFTFAIWIVLRATPRQWLSAVSRHAIWWAALFATVALPLSYLRVAGTVPAEIPPSSRTIALSAVGEALPADESRSSVHAVANPAVVRAASRPSPVTIHFPITISAGPWAARILVFWLTVAILSFIRLAASMFTLERYKARASQAPPLAAARVTHWIATCGGSNRRIRLASSPEISTPLAAGPYRPAILLPARLLGELSECDLEQVGIHEAAHLVRRDDYALLIQRAIEALFALHPVVRWITANIDLEREIACDDLVIAATGNSRQYAACLARIVESSGGIRVLPVASGAAAGRSHFARRVEALLDYRRPAKARLGRYRPAALIACMVAAIACGAARAPRVLAFAQRNAQPIAIAVPKPAPVQIVPVQKTASEPAPRLLAQAVAPARARPIANTGTAFVPVEVRDPLNRYVTGLDKDVFKVREDGVDQPISQVLDADTQADLFVLVDPRFGMSVLGPDLTRDALETSNAIVSPAKIGVGNRVQTYPPRARSADLQSLLDTAQSTGHYAQITGHPRAAMLILTRMPIRVNSLESTELFEQAELMNILRDIDIPVYTLAISPEPGQISPPGVLAQLSLETGGQYVTVDKPEDVPDALHRILIALRNIYFVGFTPRNPVRDGLYRRLDVGVTAPRGLPPLTAHSRPGYIPPAQ